MGYPLGILSAIPHHYDLPNFPHPINLTHADATHSINASSVSALGKIQCDFVSHSGVKRRRHLSDGVVKRSSESWRIAPDFCNARYPRMLIRPCS